ncbi:hypothetical protein Thi970DRAFT_02098 [Thiorhodovibrio frisius]|uniref:Uncharacterized protein n=1 Tax=Thiorhodovibrio frisius TaxID=631362 RepID=H8Z3F7_9GAMM|nr:hypothetical protein Thi970DRAFT_02098 [Thiorhodovibrio frisius]WPL21833.1 hypothetical protein Thiofri_01967 [Thiorhodovibrio frisius]
MSSLRDQVQCLPLPSHMCSFSSRRLTAFGKDCQALSRDGNGDGKAEMNRVFGVCLRSSCRTFQDGSDKPLYDCHHPANLRHQIQLSLTLRFNNLANRTDNLGQRTGISGGVANFR